MPNPPKKPTLKLNPIYNTSAIIKAVADAYNTATSAPKKKK